MQISIGQDNVHFEPKEIRKVSEFIEIATTQNWCPALFKDNYRKKENFLRADVVALDIDEGMTLVEAKEIFGEYKHAILPTRNHQKEKNGKIEDRFRVLLFLSRPITDGMEYEATVYDLHQKFPQADPACKDPSRLFYPSTDCVSYSTEGKLIEPVEAIERKQLTAKDALIFLDALETSKGELSRKTLKFMLDGAKPGQRHRELYKAARDYHQNGYSKDEFISSLQDMINRTSNWAHGKPSSKDLATIEDAFRVDPKHPARLSYDRAFLFEPIGDILNSEESFDWLVDEFLSVGGISIIAGDPKAGKSTLIRQLSRSVCRGEKFLGRKVKQGLVYYAALEEQRPLLKKQFKQIGVNQKDAIRIHAGSPLSGHTIETLQEDLSENDVALLVIDTFMLGLRIKEPNNYSEVNEALIPFREIARDTGTHILLVHHTNKSGIGSRSILGSQAIHGAVDCAMMFQKFGRRRYFSTTGRGIKTFDDHELIFDEKNLIYKLGQPKGFGDEDSNNSIF